MPDVDPIPRAFLERGRERLRTVLDPSDEREQSLSLFESLPSWGSGYNTPVRRVDVLDDSGLRTKRAEERKPKAHVVDLRCSCCALGAAVDTPHHRLGNTFIDAFQKPAAGRSNVARISAACSNRIIARQLDPSSDNWNMTGSEAAERGMDGVRHVSDTA